MKTFTTLRTRSARALMTATLALQIPLSVAASAPATNERAAVACPSQDFDLFLERFANDVEVQKAFVSTPLQNEFIDPQAQPEPRSVSQLLDKAQLNFPLMPNDQQLRNEGLTLTKHRTTNDQAMINVSKADTGYQLSLFFKREACWRLYRIQDDSL